MRYLWTVGKETTVAYFSTLSQYLQPPPMENYEHLCQDGGSATETPIR